MVSFKGPLLRDKYLDGNMVLHSPVSCQLSVVSGRVHNLFFSPLAVAVMWVSSFRIPHNLNFSILKYSFHSFVCF